jgi:uncharacterized protein (TIRG00374 family)
MTRFARRVLFAVLLGVVLYGAFVLYAGLSSMRDSLARFEWSAFVLALGLATTNYGFRFLKWEYYLARLGIRSVPKLDSLLVFLSGFVLTVTPGKVGEVFKSAVLARTHDVPAARTAPIVVAERLTDAIGVIVLIVLGSSAFAGGIEWAVAGTAAVAFGMLFVIWEAPSSWLVARLERGGETARRIAPKLAEALASLRIVAGPMALVIPTLLSVIGWACEGFALFLLLRGFGASVPLPAATFFYATATLAGALIPVPGGLGVAETMLREQFVRMGGVPAGDATGAMILIRFATLWWAVLVGFLALGVLRLRFPERLGDAASLDAREGA